MRISPLVLALLLLGGLTACGGGEPAADPGGSTSASPTSSSAPDGTETEEPSEPEVLDPCAVVPREQWSAFFTEADQAKAVLTRDFSIDTEGVLLLEREKVRYSCSLSFEGTDGYPALEWGYYAGEFTGSDLAVLLDPESDLFVNATLRHLGDPKRRPQLDRDAFLAMTEAFAAERAEFHSSH